MNDNRRQILDWQQQGLIDQKDIDTALRVTASQPSGDHWLDFFSRSLWFLSLASCAIGVIFFFAYNWESLSTFWKFTLIQSLLMMGFLVYSQVPRFHYASTGLLLFILLLIGALFALFGQTYQTGKDPWQLFALWSLFAIPIAHLARSHLIWIGFLTLMNLSLMLYFDANGRLYNLMYDEGIVLFTLLLANLACLMLFEHLVRLAQLNHRLVAQITAMVIMVISTALGTYAIVDREFHVGYFVTYLSWMALAYYLYRLKTVDLVILAAGLLSVIFMVAVIIVRSIDHYADAGAFLLISVMILGLSSVGIKWLMSISKQQSQSGETS